MCRNSGSVPPAAGPEHAENPHKNVLDEDSLRKQEDGSKCIHSEAKKAFRQIFEEFWISIFLTGAMEAYIRYWRLRSDWRSLLLFQTAIAGTPKSGIPEQAKVNGFLSHHKKQHY